MESFLNIPVVVMVGEYTTGGGPFDEDRFFMLILNSGLCVQLIPVDYYDLLAELERVLSCKLEARLTCSVVEASCVLFPKSKHEDAFVDFVPRSGFVFGLKRLFGFETQDVILNCSTMNYLSRFNISADDIEWQRMRAAEVRAHLGWQACVNGEDKAWKAGGLRE